MKFGITEKGFKRLSMPFLADPPVPQSEKYKGIIEFPGFHTTDLFDVAAAYAASRVLGSMTGEDESEIHYVTDYPVVVQLDMSGYEPQTDYDAEKVVKEVLEVHIKDLGNITENSTDEEIYDEAIKLIEFGDFSDGDYIDYSNPSEMLSYNTFNYMNNPLAGIVEEPGFGEFVRNYLQTGKMDPQMLMKATDQYRYTEDVNEDRITAVYYITPLSSTMSTYEDDEEEINGSWPGFDIPFEEDMMVDYYSLTTDLVYGEVKEGPQYQYHGTTYKRLLSAAPELVLPEPPNPPYRG